MRCPPHNHYLLICAGDVYRTQIVTFTELDEAFLGLLYEPADEMPEEERRAWLEDLHDQDRWEHDEPVGPARYRSGLEDGYIEVIRLQGKMHG